ncbi:phage tail-collar fiber domain-containing protein [Rahnella aceris]|uniref:phage tail-collar fiber domain-containing protein n=1 Tax=Rahnella sp. (strain Y9602) TaxID=2703885 RepID=UPI00365811EC
MATYKALLTTAGAAKIAAATAGGTQVNITRMVVGDGGGKLPTPDPKQTKLVNEVYRANLNRLSIDAKNSNYLVAELVIQPDVGGFWMREMGLYDADGVLIAVSNMAESYKPQLAEGSGRLQTLRMVLIVSEIESVALSIDGSTVMATKDYVDDKLSEHEKSRNHPDGTLTAKGFVQLNSSVSSTSEALAATPKAVKTANDNANTRVPATRKVNNKALNADITLLPEDVGAFSNTAPIVDNTKVTKLSDPTLVAKSGAVTLAGYFDDHPLGGKPNQAADTLVTFRRAYNAGAALTQYLHSTDGTIYVRTGAVSNTEESGWLWKQAGATTLPFGWRKLFDSANPPTAFDVGSINVPTSILTSTDINTLGFASGKTGAAIYSQPKNANATAALHYPQSIAGTLYVTPSAYGCQQMYVTFTGNIWNRGLSADWNGVDGPWKEWVPTYSANNKPTAADVGAWSASQSAASEKALSDEIATAFKIRANLTATDSPNTIRGSAMFGHYGVPGAAAATTEKGYPMNNFVGVIFVTWGPNATQQIAFNNNGRQFTRSMTGAWNGVDGPWSAWNEMYGQANKPTPADVGALPVSGTAVAASKLATARKIAGVAFDGTQDIRISAANVGALPSAGTAAAATKLATARKIAGVAFDGTKDISLSAGNVGAYPKSGGDVDGHVNAKYLFAGDVADVGQKQGTYLGWNETQGQGEGDLIVNCGTGSGGLNIRFVNKDNSKQHGAVIISGDGSLNSSGNINSDGMLSEHGKRAYTPDNPPSQFASGGWFKDVATGFMIQWGGFSNSSGNIETHNYPVAFPNACLSITASMGADVNSGNTVFVQALNPVGFRSKTTGGGMGCSYIAIGY